MRLRESGMPEEAYWETLLDVELILDRLALDRRLGHDAEPGLGMEHSPFRLRDGSRVSSTRSTSTHS